MQHDSHSSMSLLTNPLISYAEVLLAMPSSSELWFAKTSQEWKRIYLSQNTQQSPMTIANYLHDPGLLDAIESKSDVIPLCRAFLSCAWRMSWEIIQMNAVQLTAPKRRNNLIMTSRLEELVKLLCKFQLSTERVASSSPDIVMVLETVRLHLHVSLDDILVFAGIEGPDRSRAIYPSVQAWAGDEPSRKAAWHAGQILRSARLLPGQWLQGSLAMMLYHAGLVLWVYGALCVKGNPHVFRDVPKVLIDHPDSTSVQRFIQLGHGLPCITGLSRDGGDLTSGTFFLSDSEAVMDIIEATFRGQFVGSNRPLLVDKLIQIVTGLRDSSKRARTARCSTNVREE